MIFTLPVGRPAVMGVLNVTPDSFSDGGMFLDSGNAVDHALKMLDLGADLIDIGGESTRPGAESVGLETEWARVAKPIQELSKRNVPISIDTSKTEIARRAIESGAVVVNDVRALRDDGMIELCSSRRVTVCVMHMVGVPKTMQSQSDYADVVAEVDEFLLSRVAACEEAGISRGDIWIDPGIGFGKTVEQNLKLLNTWIPMRAALFSVLIGVSRKSFIGKILNIDDPLERLYGTLAAQVVAQMKGARVLRCHDVSETRQAIDVCSAILATHRGTTPVT